MGSTKGAERVAEATGRADTGCPLCCRVGLCAAVLSGLCPASLPDPRTPIVQSVLWAPAWMEDHPRMDGGLHDHSF